MHLFLPDFTLIPKSMRLRKDYLENLNKAVNQAIIEFHWSFEQANACCNSDLNALFNSQEFKRHKDAELEKFKALLKTIANTASMRRV